MTARFSIRCMALSFFVASYVPAQTVPICPTSPYIFVLRIAPGEPGGPPISDRLIQLLIQQTVSSNEYWQFKLQDATRSGNVISGNAPAIDKLPFAAPDDPILEARLAAIREEGGNPFFDQQLPSAALALRQGVGRLIRAVDDRGVLMLCDPRLTEARYGRIFLDALPPMPRTHALGDVEAFFAQDREDCSATWHD